MDGTRFSDIPDELVENILTRLSVKSLKRFSCVNKWWYNLIHNPYFISRHYSHHSSFNPKLLVSHTLSFYDIKDHNISILSENEEDCSHPSIPFYNENNYDINIIGSCINGIICLKIYSLDGKYMNDVALWNIATGEYNILPRLQFSSPPKAYLKPIINGLAFGWVPETNEYKVVMVVVFKHDIEDRDDYIHHDRPTEVYVYTLSTNSWNQLSFEVPFPYILLQDHLPLESQICVNGVCYWINYKYCEQDYKIISFHLRDEVFGTLQSPETQNHDFFLPKLYVLDGCIAFILEYFSNEKKSITFANIWVMEESWIKKFTIGPIFNVYKELRLVRDEFFFVDRSDQLLSININSNEAKIIDILGEVYYDTLLEYVESLVILKRCL